MSSGYLDPTGRTTRIFRHHDHKFEWTPEEFREWCEAEASQWGYSVEVDGIGRAHEPDPWDRDEMLGFATQTALFRRKDDASGGALLKDGRKSSDPQPPDISTRSDDDAPGGSQHQHTLVSDHYHPANPCAGKPLSLEKIQALIERRVSKYYTSNGYSVWDVWVERDISEACGGSIETLLAAIEASSNLILSRNPEKSLTYWPITFKEPMHGELIALTRSLKQGWEEPEQLIFGSPSLDNELSGQQNNAWDKWRELRERDDLNDGDPWAGATDADGWGAKDPPVWGERV